MGDSIPEQNDSSTGGNQGKTANGNGRRLRTAYANSGGAEACVCEAQITMESVHGSRTHQGRCRQGKGCDKGAAGKMTGDKELQAEGKLDKAKGEARSDVGDVKTRSAFRPNSAFIW
jgi:uncharacterized protein YjbJ (UPF0337 family)